MKYTGIYILFAVPMAILANSSMKSCIVIGIGGIMFALFLIAEHLEKLTKKP